MTQTPYQPSEEELRAVGDTSAEPAQNVPEHLRSAFLEGEPGRRGGAEVGAQVDDSQFAEPMGEA